MRLLFQLTDKPQAILLKQLTEFSTISRKSKLKSKMCRDDDHEDDDESVKKRKRGRNVTCDVTHVNSDA